MTTYQVDFINDTPDTWTFCIYQLLPDSIGLESVAWKQARVPKNGESGVQWSTEHMVCLAEYRQTGGKGHYKTTQMMRTDLGMHWRCDYADNVQQLRQAGTTTPGQLLIANNSLQLANLGIGMDGRLSLVKRFVYSGNNAQFVVKPRYYVGIFHDLMPGEIISGNQVYGPLEVVFSGGQTLKCFRARIDGHNFVFEEIGTQNRIVVPNAPR